MTAIQKKEARKRILDAATSLFARKGYGSVGIREIAKAADVNISMISYYFEGKVGILKMIINNFHDQYYHLIKEIADRDLPQEETIRLIVRNLVNFVKANRDLTMVAFYTIPLDIPEIREIKTEKISVMIKGISGLFNRLDIDPDDPFIMSIIGPALLSVILTHFRLKPIQKNVFNIEFDDVFYERYIETIATLFLHGLTGIVAANKEKKKF